MSSVDPITIINEGIIALRMLRGTPIQPNAPKVQIIVISEVTNGTMADNQLRIKIKIDTTRTTTDSGPSNIKSSYKLFFNSALIRGGPTCAIRSKSER